MEEDKRKAFKNGFLRGYMTLFGEVFNLSWDDCPADISLLEQAILARQKDQHPGDISTMDVRHTTKDWQNFPQLFFASEIEKILFAEIGRTPPVHGAPEMLFAAIKEVDTLAKWLEERLVAVRYRP